MNEAVKGLHTLNLISLLRSWRHSGFQVFVGPKILSREEGMENLARYIIRASFSQERMTYLPDESKVIYESKDGKKEKVFEVLEWLATMDSHVPGQGRTDGGVTSDFSNVCYLILNGNLQFALMKRSEVLKSLKWPCDRRDLEKKRTSSCSRDSENYSSTQAFKG